MIYPILPRTSPYFPPLVIPLSSEDIMGADPRGTRDTHCRFNLISKFTDNGTHLLENSQKLSN